MMPTFRSLMLGAAASMLGAGSAAAAPAPSLERGIVSDAATTALLDSMPPALGAAIDAGALAPTHAMQHVQLILKRPASRQAALDARVAAETTPGAAAYHRWLTPAQLASEYGPAASDIAATTGWLASRGLTVNRVSPTGMSIDFSGPVASVNAFHTAMHAFTAGGEAHMAAAVAPAIPAALSPVVAGVELSNFFPRPAMRRAPAQSPAALGSAKGARVGHSYTETVGTKTYYAVTPSDFATIYHENQAFQGSPILGRTITGAGQTLVVAERTDINPADWHSFRNAFGLGSYAGTLSLTHPGGCTDPGFTADEGEAALDAEWSSANAPDAHIVEAACADTPTTFGVETTLRNLVELGTPAVAISISYQGCEQSEGLAFLQGWENLIEEAAAEGIPVFLASGDGADAACDEGSIATSGLAVNGLASNPYDTAVGGTDFQDTALGENTRYWTLGNTATGGSALSYVPEIPWDNSCSNAILYRAVGAGGPILNCNNPKPGSFYQNAVGGGGGQSLIYAKPAYQLLSLPGMPNDGVRDIPDVSLFAANGIWNHFYLYCMSNTAESGVPCDFGNATDFFGSAAGGTSFSAPDFAGIAALIAQYDGGRIGNVAPRLYQIASLQFADPVTVKSCNASNGNAVSPICVFNDVTKGDISSACAAGTPNCAINGNATKGIGVLSLATPTDPAFPSTTGYDLATGLGTVNVTNLIVNY